MGKKNKKSDTGNQQYEIAKIENASPPKRVSKIQDEYYADLVTARANNFTVTLGFGRMRGSWEDGQETYELERLICLSPTAAVTLFQLLGQTLAQSGIIPSESDEGSG